MVRNSSQSLSEEPKTGVISMLETQQAMAATHFLDSQKQAFVSMLKMQQGMTATHFLGSQGQHCQQA